MLSKTVTTLTPESIAKFHNSCIERGQSKNTAKAYSTDLRMLLLWAKQETILLEELQLTGAMWLNQTRAESSPKTTGRRLTSLRAFARWAGEPTLLSEYKAPTPGRPIPHPIPERLEGLNRMLAVASNPEQEAMIGLLGFVGLRVGESLACDVRWFNPKTMMMRVRGKGDKERFVPVSARAWSAISTAYVNALQGDGKLIHYEDRSARKCITALGRKAGLSLPVGSHDLRSTYATIMSENGTPIRVIQELLGHANLSTTEVYTGVGTSALKDAVNF